MSGAFRHSFRAKACKAIAAGAASFALVLGGAPAFAEDAATAAPESGASTSPEAVADLLENATDANGDSLLDDSVMVDAESLEDAVIDANFDGYSVELGGDPTDGFTAATDEGQKMTVGLPFADKATAEVIGGQVHVDNKNATVSVPQVLQSGQFRVLSVIGSADAPTRFDYPIGIEGGGSITANEDGGFTVLDAAGEELSRADTPWAHDAKGATISTRYEISGNTVTQVVDTAGLKAEQFPVVADPIWSVVTYYNKVTNIKSGSATKNLKKRIGTCSIGKGGGNCQISKGKSVSRDISVSLGISRGAVAGSLGISEGMSTTTTVACTSPQLKAGTVYEAYAYGKFYTYKVEKWKRHSVGAKTTHSKVSTSGTLTAFNPWATAIHCQVK